MRGSLCAYSRFEKVFPGCSMVRIRACSGRTMLALSNDDQSMSPEWPELDAGKQNCVRGSATGQALDEVDEDTLHNL